MSDEEKLAILKNDLQLLTNAHDEFLRMLLRQAADAMQREGINLIEGTVDVDMAVVQYAAYLFRKRAGTDTAMPRFLRYSLNNILFSQKARTVQ